METTCDSPFLMLLVGMPTSLTQMTQLVQRLPNMIATWSQTIVA